MMPNVTHFEPQSGKYKRDFRLSAIHKGNNNNDWFYVFKYLDDSTFFGIQTGIGGKILKKLNDNEVKELSRSNSKFA